MRGSLLERRRSRRVLGRLTADRPAVDVEERRCKMKHPIIRAAMLIASVLTLALMTGCENDDAESPATAVQDDVPGADPSASFSITDPQSGIRTNANIRIKGVGLSDAKSFIVRVHTDKWYVQNGTLHQSQNNSWSYGGVALGGQGRYNNHIIRVEVTHADGTKEVDEITGIVRQ